MTTFNLVDEPWIPVLTTAGEQSSVSIKSALNRASEFRRIATELPTMDVAIQRVLQAILLRVEQDLPRNKDQRAEVWSEWWKAGGLPDEAIESYLERWHDRFDLFDDHHPFFQIPGLSLPKGGGSGLEKIMADVPAGTKFFTVRAGHALTRLSFAEAARWVIHAQAFDCAGIKSGVVGDDRVKGGKCYSLGYPAWSGTLGLVSLEGSTLAETLLLNLDLSSTTPEDAPAWETAPQRIPSNAIYPAPVGAAQAWTWPSRMIRLIPEGEAVVDVVLSNGERLGPQNLNAVEPMTSWKHSDAQSKQLGIDVFMPVGHEPQRAAWRGLSGLLAQSTRGDKSKRDPAGVIKWVSRLQNNEILPDDFHLRMRCVSMEYGPQASTFDQTFEDAVDLRIATMTSPMLRQAAVDAVDAARRGVMQLRDYARNIALASGDSGDNVSAKHQALETQAYDELRVHFESWLLTLTDVDTVLQSATAWEHRVSRVVRRIANDHARQCPSAAIFGRTVKLQSGEHHMDLGLAQRWLAARLRKQLPLAHPDTSEKGSDHGVGNETHQ